MRWLKKRLRNWLMDGDPSEKVSCLFTALVDGKPTSVLARSVIGIRILCSIPGKQGFVLVNADKAEDQAQWLVLWKQLGGTPMKWEDGSEVSLF